MRHFSFFNGIGGFMLAAQAVGWENMGYVEKEKWLNDLMSKRFPHAKAFSKIEDFDPLPWRGSVDIVSGGDPCQPHSIAGLGKGSEDDRYLWPEYFRCIRGIQPAWVVNENVPGSVSNGVLDFKINDLESAGYACQAYNIPAEAVGALHKRARIWLVAYNAHFHDERRTAGKHDTPAEKKSVPQRNKIQQLGQPVDLWPADTDHNGERRQAKYDASIAAKTQEEISRYFGFGATPHGHIPRHVIESGIIRMLNGLPEGMDYADRNKRTIALGNAIVWQVAAELFDMIDRIHYTKKPRSR